MKLIASDIKSDKNHVILNISEYIFYLKLNQMQKYIPFLNIDYEINTELKSEKRRQDNV